MNDLIKIDDITLAIKLLKDGEILVNKKQNKLTYFAFKKDKNTTLTLLEKQWIESNKSKEVVDEIRSITNKYYSDVTLVGNTISSIDLEKTFTKDNIIITLITIIFRLKTQMSILTFISLLLFILINSNLFLKHSYTFFLL